VICDLVAAIVPLSPSDDAGDWARSVVRAKLELHIPTKANAVFESINGAASGRIARSFSLYLSPVISPPLLLGELGEKLLRTGSDDGSWADAIDSNSGAIARPIH
jgi:hypothetical protein